MTSSYQKQTSSSSLSSTDFIASNDDVITEILLRLPAKSVLKFKLVSRRWLYLISDPNFVVRHRRKNAKTVSGFILACVLFFKMPPNYLYVALDVNENSTPGRAVGLSFDPYARGSVMISQSCNGFLLCDRQRHGSPAPYMDYIFNPAANRFSILPEPKLGGMLGIKIVHWISIHGGNSRRLDIKQETLQAMPRPPLPEDWNSINFRHFVESQGHLFFIDFDSPEYIIYEMEKDCSNWFVKDRLDINLIVSAFPDMTEDTEDSPNSLLELDYCIPLVSRVDIKNEGPSLVMYIPGKFISYGFKDNTFKTLRHPMFRDSMRFRWYHTFNYMETLSYV
ncbi:F-box protein At5g07610-like [Herrania umbratica]|uniref:F-box protein At5g07610-like n=1 Tax=Herrania umbratica TaxID=108875 RepID=A0A6J1ATG9_9ROSI|nr:F-box protein At5g07610-like [Herrania umbratica]